MKKILYMHTGSGNRGCEAIVRTSSEILEGPDNLILWSGTKQEEIDCGVDLKFEKVVASEEFKRFSFPYFEALWKRKVLRQKDANLQVFLKQLFMNNIAISVGGDNYCYPWSAEQNAEINTIIREYSKASVLWGCSIDPDAITEEVRKDLAGYDLITAREPLTFELLKPINRNVIRVADPAFTLQKEDMPLPDLFLEGNTVGINVSPMSMDYGKSKSLILDNFRGLMRFIIDNTDMNICLIPHVFWDYNNDLIPLRSLFEEFQATQRVCIIEKGNAMQLKGVIAKCRLFIGARTHATIAAYSSYVPTLVVGYSVKSRGIAIDLFGRDENYVLSVQDLNEANQLANGFIWLLDHEKDIRNQLMSIIPTYVEKAIIPAKSAINIL